MLPQAPLAILLIALCASTAAARAGETVTLAWDPNPEPDLAGYRLFWGLGSRSYVEVRDVENVTSYELQLPFDDENYFFAVTAYNDVGLESGFSNEVFHPDPPVTPGHNDQLLSIRTRENTPAQLDFSAIPDLPPIPADARFIAVHAPEHGRLEGALSGLTYLPLPNYQGPDSFRLIAYAQTNDLTTTLFKASVEVVVTPPNDPPIAYNDTVVTTIGIPVPIELLAYDFDLDPLEYWIVDAPAHGSLLGDPPQFHYLPDAAYEGEDILTFKVRDALYESELATITISIQPAEGDVHPQFLVTDEDVAIDVDLSRALSALDEDSGPPHYQLLDQPELGTLEGDPPRLVYRPHPNLHGLDQFRFEVGIEADDLYAESTVWVLIESVNDAPVAESLTVTLDEDTELDILLIGIDVDGDALTYTVLTEPTHGTLSGTPPELRYIPPKDFFGLDSFMFKVSDGLLDSDAATIDIVVNAVNDPPLAYDLHLFAEPESPRTIQLHGSDVEDDPLRFEVLTMPARGILTGTPPELVYVSIPGYEGPDQFSYWARDAELESNEATVSITIQRLELPAEEWPSFVAVASADGELTLVWTSIPGYTYRVVSRSDPVAGDWTTVSPDLVADSHTLAFSHALDPHGSATFYAIRVVSKGMKNEE
jgi:large repetitive protein